MQTDSTTSQDRLLLTPWTDFALRNLEAMVSWQQQAWEQWFRVFTAFTRVGGGAVEATSADEASAAARAAFAVQPVRTARAESAPARHRASEREHASANDGKARRRGATAKTRGRRK